MYHICVKYWLVSTKVENLSIPSIFYHLYCFYNNRIGKLHLQTIIKLKKKLKIRQNLKFANCVCGMLIFFKKIRGLYGWHPLNHHSIGIPTTPLASPLCVYAQTTIVLPSWCGKSNSSTTAKPTEIHSSYPSSLWSTKQT